MSFGTDAIAEKTACQVQETKQVKSVVCIPYQLLTHGAIRIYYLASFSAPVFSVMRDEDGSQCARNACDPAMRGVCREAGRWILVADTFA